MGSVVSSIGDFFEDVVTVVVAVVIFTAAITGIALVLATLCDACEEFMSDQLAKFFALLGIEAEDVITVNMQDQKLMEGNEDFYKNLMTQVALEHQATQMGIIDLLAVKSQGVRGSMQKYSRYGKNTYVDGLPSTTVNSVAVNKDIVDAAIQLDVGYDVTILSVQVKVPKENEWVPYRMTQLYSMNQSSMEFTYLSDVWVMTGYFYDYGIGQYKVEAYLKSTPLTTTTIAIGNYVSQVGYVARYVKDGTFDEYYWVYLLNSGNTALDQARSYLTDLDMLPIVELRRDSTNVTVDKNSERYKQTKEILGFIGLDPDVLVDSIMENPDASSVTAAYIYFGAEIGSNNPLQAKMVYNMLEYLWYDPTLESNGQHQIRVTEGNYNSSISWSKQERLSVGRTGVAIGTYEGGIGTTVDGGKNTYYGWVRKQETLDEYVEYRIWNVSATTVIMKAGLHDATMLVLAPGQTIVIPISQFFMSRFSPIEQGQLFPEILRLVTYAANVEHLKWYQTASFFNLVKIVLYAVAVVIFIFTIWSGGATAAAFMAAVKTMLIGMALGYALQLLLQQIDNPYLRAIVAAIAVVAAVYTSNQKAAGDMMYMVANTITEAVTNYADAVVENVAEQFAELSAEAAVFAGLLNKRQEELDKANEGMQSVMTTEEVMKLSRLDAPGYVEGVDLKYYRAIQMQYEWDLVKSMQTQTKIYDYDNYYKLGVM